MLKNAIKRVSALMFAFIIMMMSTTALAAGVGTVDYFEVDSESPLKGMRVAFLGDSICEARCEWDTKYAEIIGWAGRIGVHNGMTWHNLGKSGASVSNCRGANTIINQVYNAYSTVQPCDIYILHGGTNDAWDSAPVGTFDNNDFSGTYDKSTFAGGLVDVFYTIKKSYPNALFGYIINFRFTNTNIGRLTDMKEYVDVTKGICDKWEVPYLDLYSNTELLARLQPQTKLFLSDGIHPTTAGYDLITPYVEDWLKGLVGSDSPAEEVVSSEESSVDENPVSSVESKTESAGQESSEVPADNDAEDDNILLIVAIVVVALAVAVVVALVVILVLRKKKK